MLTKQSQEEICACIANGFPLFSDYQEGVVKIKQGKPIFLLGQIPNHAFSIFNKKKHQA